MALIILQQLGRRNHWDATVRSNHHSSDLLPAWLSMSYELLVSSGKLLSKVLGP